MMKLGKIIQPEGVNYLIKYLHHSKFYAQEYVDMLISKMENAIEIKRTGGKIGNNMSLEKMEEQLANMKQFKVIEVDE